MAGKTDSLYISNLSYSSTDESLGDGFPGCTKAKVIIDQNTGRSKGFGFVTFESPEAAEKMYDRLNGEITIDGRECKVHYAHTREEREDRQGRYRDSYRRGGSSSSGSRYSGGYSRDGGSRDGGSRDSYSRGGGYGRDSGYSREGGYSSRDGGGGYSSRDGGYSRDRDSKSGYGGYKNSYSGSGGSSYTKTGYGYSSQSGSKGDGYSSSGRKSYNGDSQ